MQGKHMGARGTMKNWVKVLLAEDWLAVVIAFTVILLAAVGIFGKNGLNITF